MDVYHREIKDIFMAEQILNGPTHFCSFTCPLSENVLHE
jgi:hypothetical protein